MNETDKNGGFAFPAAASCVDGTSHLQEGMTLRDWFAGMALQGIITTSAFPMFCVTGIEAEMAAKTAYAIADAMIAERIKQ